MEQVSAPGNRQERDSQRGGRLVCQLIRLRQTEEAWSRVSCSQAELLPPSPEAGAGLEGVSFQTRGTPN